MAPAPNALNPRSADRGPIEAGCVNAAVSLAVLLRYNFRDQLIAASIDAVKLWTDVPRLPSMLPISAIR